MSPEHNDIYSMFRFDDKTLERHLPDVEDGPTDRQDSVCLARDPQTAQTPFVRDEVDIPRAEAVREHVPVLVRQEPHVA